MKILFVATRKNSDPTERELYEMDLMLDLLGFERSLLDLGLLTIAACTPPRFEVAIHDEYLSPIDFDAPCDLVALSAKTSCVARAYEVAREFRRRGRKVVLGGIHASLRPEEAMEHVDCVVTGEAEEIWPRVLGDLERGTLARRYDAPGLPDLAKVPPPRWEAIDARRFLFHQIQTTRGCPFRCRFCSVPDISGSTFRFKPAERVAAEVRALPRGGKLLERMKALYVVDDNFISRTRYTKELLEALVPLRRSGELGDWSAETTFNVAVDDELLALFQEAGCTTLIIGFESISEATLAAMRKDMNFCISYQDGVEKIHRHGMSIVGNFIVGFDTDMLSVFRDTRDFIFENNILYPFFSILTPMPGTQLHEEYKAAGRLHTYDWKYYDTRHVIYDPVHMSKEQLMDGYIWLYEQCYASDRALANLERFWVRPERRGSTLLERLYVRFRVARSQRISARNRRFFERGMRLMERPGKKGEVAQLFYFLDSGHFAEFLDRYKSESYEDHAELFERGGEHVKMQWENQRVRRRAVTSAAGTAAAGASAGFRI